MSKLNTSRAWVSEALRQGQVIPAHPLALTPLRKLDETRQRALTRYYHASGAGGLAVGVHTTQFEIRDPQHSLLKPVLELAATTAKNLDQRTGRQTVLIAGICGKTAQAVAEAQGARAYGYHAGLLSLAAWRQGTIDELIDHCQAVAEVIPLFGFYLQPAVGGRLLPAEFWRRFCLIPNVLAIKIAPFNRYQTLEVLRAVAESGRADEIALYTGNDDNIVLDLLTPFEFQVAGKLVRVRMAGGLLGHWACWTQKAAALLSECHRALHTNQLPSELLTRAAKITDANSALFDAANGFKGCIAGIHEVLRRQGLMASIACLNPHEGLSPSQSAEIDRIGRDYPELNDDDFVQTHLDDWLND